jgi:hypothetical protein
MSARRRGIIMRIPISPPITEITATLLMVRS